MGNENVTMVPKGIDSSWNMNAEQKNKGIEKAKEFLETVKNVSEAADTVSTVIEALDTVDGMSGLLSILEKFPLVGIAAGVISAFLTLFAKDTSKMILDLCKAEIAKEISEFLMVSLQAKFEAAQIQICYGKIDSAHGKLLEALILIELVFENNLKSWVSKMECLPGIQLTYKLRQMAILLGHSYLSICQSNILQMETNRVNRLKKIAKDFLLNQRLGAIIKSRIGCGDAYLHVQYGDKLFNIDVDDAFASHKTADECYAKIEAYSKETMILWEKDLD